MPVTPKIVCALLGLCASAGAHPLLRGPAAEVSPQTLSAAAVRIAAPFGTITSTFRTPAHNRAVGGVKDSYHLFGQAIDIVRRRGVSHAQIAAALTAGGLHLIESLDEGSHSHFAFAVVPRPMIHIASQPSVQPRPALLAADQHGTLLLDLRSSAAHGRSKLRLPVNSPAALHWKA